VGSDGTPFSGESGLAFQGVRDGALLTVSVGADQRPPRVYDDIVEAMSDAVEEEMSSWKPAASRRTALAAAALLLLIGAGALVLMRLSLVAGSAAGVVALLLVVAAIVLSRLKEEDDASIMLGWLGAVYAAAAGFTATAGSEQLGLPIAVAGAGMLVAGLAAALGLARRGALLHPAVLLGVLVAIGGAVVHLTDARPGQVAVAMIVAVVLLGGVVPRLTLAMTRSHVPQAYTHDDLTAEPEEIRETDVRRDAHQAHAVLLAVAATVGILVTVLAPLAVQRGVTGTLLAVCAAAVVMLRTRQYRGASEVAAGLALGVAALGTTALGALLQHPDWRPVVGLTLAVVGSTLLLLTLTPSTPAVRRGRLGDVAEMATLVAMIPLLAFSLGLVSAVRG
jgi:type VII secretion integral membrane protein EccD